MVEFHVQLFGTFHIEQKGQSIHLPTRKTESLLAYLVLHPTSHTREKLATLFWGESSDDAARGSLRKALNLLRQHLGKEIILADREKVQLNPDYSLHVDALEFEDQASRFLSAQNTDINSIDFDLYQEDLLTDFYDEWILAEREHYHTLYIKASLRAVEHLRARSEYELVIQHARKVLMFDAANEQAFQHLIFCHAALGDRNGALQQYEACQHALETELGAEPARETQALHTWITQSSADASLAARITNLPIPASSFIGRGHELTEIKQLLSNTRLLTLTGVGGSGKTRLVIRTATDLIDSFKNGVWWVDLSSIADEILVPQSVAKVFGIKESQQQSLIESIITSLQQKELLLVIDNCEHLVGACAQIVTSLLTQCPQLKILTTSRETLRVDGEIAYSVPTLPTPNKDKISLAELLLDYESVKLFVERARAFHSKFVFDNHTALFVAQICARLDGIPLAIELAAARVRTMSVEQIATHLNDVFSLLTDGNRTALPRQQTLRAMIDWSYDLLAEHEKTLFRRLAVFMGGWSLEAAEAVCSGEGIKREQILDCLSQLVHKSMIFTENIRGETRFHMLETLRQYAHEKLFESTEAEAMRNRHLDFYMTLAEDLRLKLRTAERIARRKQLEIEHDNFRTALTFSLAEPKHDHDHDKVERGVRMACALELFWKYLGYYHEGRSWLENGLARLSEGGLSSSALYARALYSNGHLASNQEDYTYARPLLEESVALYKSVKPLDIRGLADALETLATTVQFDDLALAHALSIEAAGLCRLLGPDGIPDLARALFYFSYFVYRQGDFNTAQSHAAECRTLWQQTGNVWQSAGPTGLLGHIAFRRRDYTTARAYYEESLQLFREVEDNPAVAAFTSWIGDLDHVLGDYAGASRRYQESLKMWQTMGIKQQVGLDLRDLGIVEMHQGNFEHAKKLLQESLPLLKLHSANPSKDISIALNLIGLSEIARKQNQRSRAARLLGAAEAVVTDSASNRSGKIWLDSNVFALGFDSLDEYEQLKDIGHEQLDEFAWLEGQAMTIERAIEYALESN